MHFNKAIFFLWFYWNNPFIYEYSVKKCSLIKPFYWNKIKGETRTFSEESLAHKEQNSTYKGKALSYHVWSCITWALGLRLLSTISVQSLYGFPLGILDFSFTIKKEEKWLVSTNGRCKELRGLKNLHSCGPQGHNFKADKIFLLVNVTKLHRYL